MATEVKHRRHWWLGHVLRMEQISKKCLRWNPPDKRKQGRTKMTLRKTFEVDLKRMDLTRGTAEREAKERHSLKEGVAALSLIDRCNQRRRRLKCRQ